MLGSLDRRTAAAAFFIGAGAVLIAISLGLAEGGAPSAVAYQQQVVYLTGIPLLGLLILTRDRLSRALWAVIALCAMALFFWGAYMAGWQSGVALGLWADGTVCSSLGRDVDLSSIPAVEQAGRPCGIYMVDLLGLPLPFANVLVSSAMVVLVGYALLRRVSRDMPQVHVRQGLL